MAEGLPLCNHAITELPEYQKSAVWSAPAHARKQQSATNCGGKPKATGTWVLSKGLTKPKFSLKTEFTHYGGEAWA